MITIDAIIIVMGLLLTLILNIGLPIVFLILLLKVLMQRKNERAARDIYKEAMQELDDLEEDLKNHKET